MKTSRNVLLAIAAGGALLTAVPAFAQNWNHGYGQRHYSAAGPRYYGPPRVAYGPPPGDAVAYCMQQYRSYDPRSGTYLGYDGFRHPCP